MSSKHTPGPWRVGKTAPNMCPTVGTHKGLLIAMVSCGEKHPAAENARLIAAAPDMLEALEAAQESIATFIGVHKYPMDSGAGDILRLVDAAIAKAKGDE